MFNYDTYNDTTNKASAFLLNVPFRLPHGGKGEDALENNLEHQYLLLSDQKDVCFPRLEELSGDSQAERLSPEKVS